MARNDSQVVTRDCKNCKGTGELGFTSKGDKIFCPCGGGVVFTTVRRK